MQPQPASPVPQHAPPPKSGPNWLKIVGIGCGVLVLLAALCGAGMFFFCKSVTASKDDAQAFLGELRAGDTAAAYARMDPGYRARHDLASFQQGVATLPALSSNVDATFTSFNVTNGLHDLRGTLTTPTGPVPIHMTLVSGGSGYVITGLEVGGRPLPP